MPRKPIAKPSEQTGTAPGATTKADTPSAPQAETEDDFAALLATATGTTHRAFSTALLSDTARTLGLPADHPDREAREAALFGLMKEFRPADGVEGALASAFTGLHTAGMQLLARAANPTVPGEQASRLRRDAQAMFRTSFETLSALRGLRGAASVDTNRHG